MKCDIGSKLTEKYIQLVIIDSEKLNYKEGDFHRVYALRNFKDYTAKRRGFNEKEIIQAENEINLALTVNNLIKLKGNWN